MTDFFKGITYNLKGLSLGLRTPKLLMLGLLRFAILMIFTLAAAVLILVKYQEIMNLMWNQPQSVWIAWLWHLLSWVLALLLTGVAAIVGFLVAQVLFSVLIMDYMSQIVEFRQTGKVQSAPRVGMFRYFLFLLRQEIPRAVLPILILLGLLLFGWFTPLGPVLTIVTSLAAVVFLAWDNTDLVPARRLVPLGERFRLMRRSLPFHLGFGLLFLIPLFNLLLISFAPVGATLYIIEQERQVSRGVPGH
jgi:CysZ protein